MLHQKQEELLALVKEKDDLEKEIEGLSQAIVEYDKKNLDKNLVDKDGFPREDLNFGELVEFKNLKRKLREKQNDLAALMKVIEKGLFSMHEHYRNSGQAEKDIENYEQNLSENNEAIRKPVIQKPAITVEPEKELKSAFGLPFAQITEVSDESPSFEAGIRLDDLIVKFGDCDYYNNNNLQYMAELVKGNINKEIGIELLREVRSNEEECKETVSHQGKPCKLMKMIIVPRIWKGQGVLGYAL